MSIKKVFKEHFKLVFNEQGERECQCGFFIGNGGNAGKLHKRHAIDVLEQHEREREAAAWESCSDAWEYAHSLDNHEPWEHVPPNPYRSQS